MILESLKVTLKPAFFNAGYNDQVFFSKSWKKNWPSSVLSLSRKTQKPLNSDPLHSVKMTSPSFVEG